ncbi:tRNA (guanosine(46)-N7)-methyltransferase TrmB [Stieleria sp. TO1_6]|uniref:tRNA (guanosine(46)-N7)-methyltransferase TrmB n=1 Tax=Stieleria tagensis TaxID=2956795 RepID=UPI00209AE54D|nr:tRNA (guanosine(46)-N7)-methyltransferase TrmB [Stieleria tagensis]MCO8122185.1 tRNA (guanosine(46)-N7)-methyltransferase TrmB [Stieleria tagensis]
MPRSPIRAPKPSLDLSGHLLIFRSPIESPQAGDPDPVPETLTSESLFQNQLPLEIEVGSGKGLFLTSESARNPDHNYLGIEIIHKYAKHSAARLARAGRTNAKMVSGNAEPLFSNHVPAGSLEAVHVYFPDPWWKKRHRKRRVVNQRSIQNFLTALRPGGRFHFWTDVLDYFESTIELIAEIAPEFGVPIPEEKQLSTHDLDYRTHFERRSRKNQIPVYRVRYEKK